MKRLLPLVPVVVSFALCSTVYAGPHDYHLEDDSVQFELRFDTWGDRPFSSYREHRHREFHRRQHRRHHRFHRRQRHRHWHFHNGWNDGYTRSRSKLYLKRKFHFGYGKRYPRCSRRYGFKFYYRD